MTGPHVPPHPGTPAPTTGAGPLVVVCLRIGDLRPAVDPLDGTVTRDRWGVGLPPADAAALEHALRMTARWGGGRVVAVCAGPESADRVLREVAALGVTVVRVPAGDEADAHRYLDELADDERGLARTLMAAVRGFGSPDLVLCGDRSVDRGTGALPAYLAHELGCAQALGLVALDTDGPGALLVERRLDGGWRERLRVPLPAVCSVEAAGVRLRRASLAGALAVDRVPPPVERPRDVAARGPSGDPSGGAPTLHIGPGRPFAPRTHVLPAPEGDDPRLRLLALTGALVAHDLPTVVQPADAAEAADLLLDYLVRHGYLAAPPDDGDAPGSGGTPS
jgi:electron transfer flavoprotein beta subunit